MLRFILKLLKTLLYLAVAGGLVLFAVMNRAPMTISLSPFPFEMTLPASFFALGVFILGLLMGYGLALSGT